MVSCPTSILIPFPESEGTEYRRNEQTHHGPRWNEFGSTFYSPVLNPPFSVDLFLQGFRFRQSHTSFAHRAQHIGQASMKGFTPSLEHAMRCFRTELIRTGTLCEVIPACTQGFQGTLRVQVHACFLPGSVLFSSTQLS